MIRPLPHWVLTGTRPAIYDTESITAIEMVAKLYGKMEELISDYNEFVDNINSAIQEFENDINQDFNCFKNSVIKTMNDYIEVIDTKINLQDTKIDNKFEEQDTKIEEAIQYMKDNIIATTTNIINQAIEDGTLYVGVSYDSTTESLNIITERSEE